MKKTVLFLFWGIALILHGLSAPAQTAPQGKYLLFNGIDQHLLITNHADFNIAAGESYTICCRILAENFDSQYSIFSKGNNLVTNGFYELSTYRTSSGPNIGLSVINSENTNLGAPYFHTVPAQTWIHVAWVYNAGEKNSKIYVNGYLMNSVFNTAIGRVAVQNNSNLNGTEQLQEKLPAKIEEFSLLRWQKTLSLHLLLTEVADVQSSHPQAFLNGLL